MPANDELEEARTAARSSRRFANAARLTSSAGRQGGRRKLFERGRDDELGSPQRLQALVVASAGWQAVIRDDPGIEVGELVVPAGDEVAHLREQVGEEHVSRSEDEAPARERHVEAGGALEQLHGVGCEAVDAGRERGAVGDRVGDQGAEGPEEGTDIDGECVEVGLRRRDPISVDEHVGVLLWSGVDLQLRVGGPQRPRLRDQRLKAPYKRGRLEHAQRTGGGREVPDLEIGVRARIGGYDRETQHAVVEFRHCLHVVRVDEREQVERADAEVGQGDRQFLRAASERVGPDDRAADPGQAGEYLLQPGVDRRLRLCARRCVRRR